MKYAFGAVFFVWVISATSVASMPRLLSPEEEQLVLSTLAQSMLDPESTIVSDIVGANALEDPNATWVCGKVRGKNGLGGYAQPVPFMGMISPLNAGGTTFIVIAIADANAASQSSVLTTCIDKIK